MSKYRFRVGSYESDLSEEELTAVLEATLAKHGTLSSTPSRGLMVVKMNNLGRPGTVSHQVMGVLSASRSALSEAKIGRKLPDLGAEQITGALKRMKRNGDIDSQRTNQGTGRYKYYIYSLTDQGRDKFESRAEAQANGKANVRKIWSTLQDLEYKKGDEVDAREVAEAAGITAVDFRVAWELLEEKGVVRRTRVEGRTEYWLGR